MVSGSDPLSLVFVLIFFFSRSVIFTVVSEPSFCLHLQSVIAQLRELPICWAVLVPALCRSSWGGPKPGMLSPYCQWGSSLCLVGLCPLSAAHEGSGDSPCSMLAPNNE